MKKLGIILIISVFLLLSCGLVFASDATVYCDNEKIEFSEGPYVIDGSTFVPVRGLGEALDFKYTWDQQNRTVIITSQVAIAWVQADNDMISVNKDGVMYSVYCESYPRIINDRIFIPLRAISELFEADVQWDGSTSSVHITTKASKEENAFLEASEDVAFSDGSLEVDAFVGDDAESSIDIDDFSPPGRLTKGRPYVLSGTVTSGKNLDRLNIKIIDVETDTIEINETAFNISNNTYSLSDIDSRITFGVLSIGEKIMQITCVDSDEFRQNFEYEFEIYQPTGSTVKNEGEMLWPVPASGLITTIFWCDNPNCHSNAGRVNGHAALDIAADRGAEVVAVMDGVVKLQGFGNYENQKTGYGNFVLIDHGDGLETQYAHLNEILVVDNQEVKAGDVIGTVGSTGNSSGPHLDFYITQDEVRCDPLYYLTLPEDVRCYEPCDLPYFYEALYARGIEYTKQ